jgi:hypothetical protein
MRETIRLKFRAECQTDVFEFLGAVQAVCRGSEFYEWVRVTEWVTSLPYSDAVVTIATNLPLWKIRNVMVTVLDGHVMVETLRLEAEYTGERTYV